MFCPNCGTQVQDGANFCPSCGSTLSMPTPAAPQAQPIPQAQPVPQSEPFAPQPMPTQPQAVPPLPTDLGGTYAQQPYEAPQQTYGAPQEPYGVPQQQYGAPQQPNGAPQQPYGAPQPQQPAGQQAYGASYGQPVSMPASTTASWNPFSPVDPQVMAYAESRGYQMKWYKALTIVLLFLSALGNAWAGIQNFVGIGDVGRAMFYPHESANFLYGICLLGFAAAAIYVRMQLAAFKKNGPRLYIIMSVASGVVGFIYNFNMALEFANRMMWTSSITTLIVTIVLAVLNAIYFKKRAELFVY